MLSQAGRLALIKSTLTSLPLYFASIFRISKGVVHQINTLTSGFFWSGGSMNKKCHRVKWKLATRAKKDGGLGILNIVVHNRALLLKWLWRLQDEGTALWARIIHHKYSVIRIDNIFVSSAKHYSTIWLDIAKNIMANDHFTSILLNCFSFDVSDGSTILFWHDQWVENGCLKVLFPSLFVLSTQPLGLVSDYGIWQEGNWNWRLC